MEDVMTMMEENKDGHMEFQRDVMLEDCFSGAEEPLYGFMTNVTIPEDMLDPCIVDVECFSNGTSINLTNSSMQEDMTSLTNISDVGPPFLPGQGKYV